MLNEKKNRFPWILALPLLLTAAVGCFDEVDGATEQLRGIEVEPCLPEDCLPTSASVEVGDCPPGTEYVYWAECVDNGEGVCVFEFYEECVPVDEPRPEPEPAPHDGPMDRQRPS